MVPFSRTASTFSSRSITVILSVLAAMAGFELETAHGQKPFQFLQPATAVWKRFAPPDEEFAVLMPGDPKPFVTSITDSAGRSTPKRVYSSYADGCVYLVISYEASSLAGTLENYKVDHVRGELNGERDVRAGAYEGKEYTFNLGDIAGIVRIFATSRHGYAVATIQTSADVRLREYFLSSLRFTDNGSPAGDSNGTLPPAPDRVASSLPVADATEKPLSSKAVTRKAVWVSKPQPSYTEEARRLRIAGSVVLRVVLSASGEVTNVQVVSGLPSGLSEQAIEAAKSVRFMPAVKDGKFVSTWVELLYTFNLDHAFVPIHL